MFSFWQKYALVCVHRASGGSWVALRFVARELLYPGQTDIAAFRDALKAAGDDLEALDLESMIPVEGMLVIRNGEHFYLDSGEHISHLTDEFLSTCARNWAEKLIQAMADLS